ncbi:alpha/beta hydrolase [Protaetiibacter mangrovi]|uniref:Alpha/beta hydrolase n=1 Tax=Protaetiibacter mangrovi TaxID=2970926 RepID=A0ABT1ZGS1_9MICO|nr:alpha/beta hydrolase [Protaetiibacter mangrovi]MCS0499896.1 alpha/beta hydrolase [Protaetiibacter mangrovi]TPX05363.1 alpha/beta hydrolase [Schumannella luteola]
MDIEQVDVDLRDTVARMPSLDASKTINRRIAALALAIMPAARAAGVRVSTRRDGGAKVRVYEPAEKRTDAALLWIHGGGLVIGDPRQDEALVSGTAAELGMVVVSAHYRLAPEHPFPAGLDDTLAAWEWLQRHAAELGVDPGRIVVGGESAGGGLAASLVHRLHDAGAHPLAQWLFCPMLDDRTAADTTLDAVDHLVWNNVSNRFGWTSYLGQAPGGEVPPYAVPARRIDLAGLPPAWICVGDIELFHDEDVDYARRLESAGVQVTLDVTTGTPHGFENWARDSAPARALLARARTWLADRIGIEARA